MLRHPVTTLTPNDRFVVEGEPFIPAGRTRHGYEFFHAKHPGRVLKMTHGEIYSRLEDKTAEIEYRANDPGLDFLTGVLNGKQFRDFGPSVRLTALQRVALFELYEEECLVSGPIARPSETFYDDWIVDAWRKVNGRGRSDQPTLPAPSTATFNRLYKEWRTYDRNILAIVPRYRGPGCRNLELAESISFMVAEARLFMGSNRPEKTQVFEWYKAALSLENEQREADGRPALRQFGQTKFFEIIDGFPEFDVMVAREGEAVARAHFAPNTRSYNAVLPGSRIEIDEWKTDLMTVWASVGLLNGLTTKQIEFLKKVRVWICVAIDVATRYVLALKVVRNPNGQACLDAIRMIMSDKTGLSASVGATTPWIGKTKPGEIYWDHGSAFIKEDVVAALKVLNIGATRPETGKARGRPHIESLFHVIGPLLTQFWSGRTFRSVEEKGDYDAKAHASLAAGEFGEIMTRGAVDYYNNNGHGALGGQSPHNAWIDALERREYMHPPSRLAIIRAMGARSTASIGRYGIVHRGIPYSSTWLVEEWMDIGSTKVNCIIDSGYLNSIAVQARDGRWVEVENKIDLPENLTEAEWTRSRSDYLQRNRKETEESYLIQRAFILENRERGIAATLNAGLESLTASPAKIEKARRQLFRNYVAAVPSGTLPSYDMPALPPADAMAPGVMAPSLPTAPPLLEHDEALPTLATSNFEPTNWDDEDDE